MQLPAHPTFLTHISDETAVPAYANHILALS